MLNKTKIRDYLVNNGLTDEQYNCIRDDVVESNKNNNTITCSVAIVYLVIMLVLSLTKVVHVEWIVYFLSLIVVVTCLVLNQVCIVKGSRLLKYLIYTLVVNMMVVGLLAGTIYDPDNYVVSYIVFMILLPVLFTDRCYRECIVVFLMQAIFLVVAYFTKSEEAFIVDVMDVLLFGSISMISTTFLSVIKVKSFWKSYLITKLATKDSLTGVNNRASFDANLNGYLEKTINTAACIFMDVNELHVYNNTYGHAAGDVMLQTISEIIQSEIFVEDIYRTGGDEFVCFILEKDLDDVLAISRSIRNKVEASKYSISIGVHTMIKADLDMKILIGEAEKYMYQNKKRYYDEKGIEIRNEIRS